MQSPEEKAKILNELKEDFKNMAEEYMYFYGVTRQEFADAAKEVANKHIYADDRDEEDPRVL